MNTYGYVLENPIIIYDSHGLLSTSQAYMHYFSGDGSSLTASFSEVDSGATVNSFPRYPGARDSYIAGAPQGHVSFADRKSIDIGGAVFGHVTFLLSGEFTSDCSSWKFDGEISAANDIFDFDSKPWGVRDYWKEVATRSIGGIPGGNPYEIEIDGSRKVADGGSL